MPSIEDGERPSEETNADQPAQIGPITKVRRQSIANERAARAVDMRTRQSKTYSQIANELGISTSAAMAAYNRGVRMLVPREEMDEARQRALATLDQWQQMMLEEYYRENVMVNFGKVIKDDNGVPLLDYSHRQSVMDRLIKIERERRAIAGYAAPSKRVLEVITADMFDKAIKQLNAEAAALEQQHADAEAALGLKALMRDSTPADLIEDAEVIEDE